MVRSKSGRLVKLTAQIVTTLTLVVTNLFISIKDALRRNVYHRQNSKSHTERIEGLCRVKYSSLDFFCSSRGRTINRLVKKR